MNSSFYAFFNYIFNDMHSLMFGAAPRAQRYGDSGLFPVKVSHSDRESGHHRHPGASAPTPKRSLEKYEKLTNRQGRGADLLNESDIAAIARALLITKSLRSLRSFSVKSFKSAFPVGKLSSSP